MVHKSTYYNVNDIPQEFIGEQLTHIAKNWGCTPARSLSDICDAIAKEWAKSVNDPSPWLAHIEATGWEPVPGSVYSMYRNSIVEIEKFKSVRFFHIFIRQRNVMSNQNILYYEYRQIMGNPV